MAWQNLLVFILSQYPRFYRKTFGNRFIDKRITTPIIRAVDCVFTQAVIFFSGDTLFVGDSGATNLPGGDRTLLGASLRRIMAALPDDTVIWPGHDYGEAPSSTIGWEKSHNANAKEYGFYQNRPD